MDKTMNQLVMEHKNTRQYANTLIEKALAKDQISTQIYFDQKNKLINGIYTVAKAVGSTLGARGRLVMFSEGRSVRVTKDGATVIKNISLDNPIENYGASLLLEAANKTAYEAGDGTTTTTLLVENILRTLLFSMEENRNFYEIERGMYAALLDIKNEINNEKINVNREYLYKVAFTSSNNNKDIAESIVKIYDQLPNYNIDVLFHKSDLREDKVVVEEGYEISHKSTTKTKKIVENPNIVLLAYKVESLGQHLARTVLLNSEENKTPVLFICNDYSENFLAEIKHMSNNYFIPMYAVKVDSYGTEAMNQMEDLSQITGAYIIEEPLQEPASADILGKVKTLLLNLDNTKLLTDHPIDTSHLEELYNDVNDFVEKDNILRRINKMKAYTANYYVGGQTPQEMEERFYRIEDAVLACKVAAINGVVPGGGVTYLKIYDKLKLLSPNTDYDIGYSTIVKSLCTPFEKLCQNSYIETDQMIKIYDHIVNNKYNCIYNFSTDQFETDITIYDTATTATVALQAAISVASTIILTNTIIV